jgi:hypothetical protein
MSCTTIVLTEKELKDFNDKKTSAFQGTMILCGVYAIVAIILLLTINFTTFGKDIIYDKFMPFIITYVFGAIFIIIYLVITIYNLQPTKERKPQNNDIICPDYWKLKELTSDEIKAIKTNTVNTSNLSDDDIRYKCEIDKKIAPLANYKDANANLNYGFTGNYLSTGNDINNPNYIYTTYNAETDKNNDIKNYAQIAGIYNKDSSAPINANSLTNNVSTDNTIVPIGSYSATPLICNEVYPQYLARLDENSESGNKNRCEYAKKCNIAWNDIGC